jgi:hypothetical protein
MSDGQDTKVQRYTRWFTNHPVYSVAIVAGLAVIGLATFTNSVRDILALIPTGERSPKIQIECHFGSMPNVVPEEGRIYVLSLFPTPIESGGGGLVENFATPGSEWSWSPPDKRPITGYSCRLTNYSDAPVFNVEMSLGTTFIVAVRNPNTGGTQSGDVYLSRRWLIRMAKINAGEDKPFTFYVMNISAYFALVTLPDVATLQMDSDGAKQTVTLIKPTYSDMNFAPAD